MTPWIWSMIKQGSNFFLASGLPMDISLLIKLLMKIACLDNFKFSNFSCKSFVCSPILSFRSFLSCYQAVIVSFCGFRLTERVSRSRSKRQKWIGLSYFYSKERPCQGLIQRQPIVLVMAWVLMLNCNSMFDSSSTFLISVVLAITLLWMYYSSSLCLLPWLSMS